MFSMWPSATSTGGAPAVRRVDPSSLFGIADELDFGEAE